MTQQQPRTAADRARAAYEDSEQRLSSASEQLVSSQGFAEALSMVTSNAVALSRIAGLGLDQLIRASRLAGRRDITRIGRQLARTEDKLEQVLQIVEQLEEELAITRTERDSARERAASRAPRAARTTPRAARMLREVRPTTPITRPTRSAQVVAEQEASP